jgi:hypothetical protein
MGTGADLAHPIAQTWPVNPRSTGSLLVGFFDYYCSTFHLGRYVVGVREPAPLLKKDLNWQGSAIAVQGMYATLVYVCLDMTSYSYRPF